MNNYIIYISKRRDPDDRFGLFWGKIELSDYDEDKAKAKYDFLKVLLGDNFVVTMMIKTDK